MNSLDDIQKVLISLNKLTDSLYHLKEDGTNQRLIISAKTQHPLTWKVSKVENTKPIGIIKLTMEEDPFNTHTDYIEKDDDGYITGMWADYWQTPTEPEEADSASETAKKVICTLSASNSTIKDGGSSKTITAKYSDSSGMDISGDYSEIEHVWTYEIDGADVSEAITTTASDGNLIKIKLKTNDRKYLGKILTVTCEADGIIGTVQLYVSV